MPWSPGRPEPTPDPRLTAAFAGCLPGPPLAGPLLAFTEVDSTQTVCRRLATTGAPQGLVVVADHQTAGRGRRDRRWTAPPGTGLLLSSLLRPTSPPARWPALTLLAAGAVVEAVDRCAAVTARIRPPNDVLVGERKLAGILAEAVVGVRPFVVLGIGVNVAQRPGDWPADLAGRAVSLAELGRPVAREEVLRALLAALAARYATFEAPVPVG